MRSELNYKRILDNLPTPVAIANFDGRLLYINDKFIKTYGYTYEEISYFKFYFEKAFPDKDYRRLAFQYWLEDVKQASNSKESISNPRELQIVCKNNSVKNVEIRTKILDDNYLYTYTDISERSRLIDELSTEKRFVEKLTNNFPGVFFMLNSELKVIRCNKKFEEISGYSAEELNGATFYSFQDESDKELKSKALEQLREKKSITMETTLLTKNKSRIPMLYNGFINEFNEKEFIVFVGLDISEFHKKESELIQSREKFQYIFNSTTDAIFIFNYDFKILTANKTFLDLMEFEESEIDTINMFDYILTENAKTISLNRIKLLEKGISGAYQYNIRNKSGRVFPIEIRAQFINYNGFSAILGSFNDISERKQLEKEIYFASTQAAEKERGRFAKELHDGLGPLLSTCRIYLHNIENGNKTEQREALENLEQIINDSITSIKEISNNISPRNIRNHGLIQTLKSFIDKINNSQNKLYIKCLCDNNIHLNELTEITIYRIITELINNTMKYAEANSVIIQFNKKVNYWLIEYSDNGEGFDYDQTIKLNKGFGLLNINSRINSIGGEISYLSKPGKGVQVKIKIKTNNSYD